jgi:ribosomal-protein-alanine N-acetyltransferase
MIGFLGKFLGRLFARGEPALSEAGARDAAAIATLHAASFRRGWSELEVEALLTERNVIAHCATIGGKCMGFIIARRAIDEAEILSVAIAPARRGKGLARKLLTQHLRCLAALGVRTVFLEVGEHNQPAIRLYDFAGFHEVGRRPNYYLGRNDKPATALVLRRDL